jgi:DTW domain-containing protein YfiP
MSASEADSAAPAAAESNSAISERGRSILMEVSGRHRRIAEKKNAIKKEKGACPRCYLGALASGVCICEIVKPLPCPHAVTCFIHATELFKVSSTHQILLRGLQHSQLAVWKSPVFPEAKDVWQDVVKQCEVSGKTPCVLYPSREAIPAGQFFSSLSPSQRRAGLHVVVLDGTWNNVMAMEKELPDATIAPRVVITPPATFTLFGPLRAPPSPGRVSTLEAVAFLFDELREALRDDMRKSGKGGLVEDETTATGKARSDVPPPPGSFKVTIKRTVPKATSTAAPAADATASAGAGVTDDFLAAHDADKASKVNFMKASTMVTAGSDGSSAAAPTTAATKPGKESSKEVLTMEMIVAPPTPQGIDFWASSLRRFLQVHVDATLKQCHKLHPWSHGVGYRTWYLTLPPNAKAIGGKEEDEDEGGEGEGDDDSSSGPQSPSEVVPLAGPYLSTLPCHLITRIAQFCYGEDKVLMDGYAVSFERAVSDWGKIDNPTKNIGLPPARRWPPSKCVRTVEVAETTGAADGGSGADAGATATTFPKHVRRLDPIERQFLRPLPDPKVPYTSTPLALTCRALYILFSGHCLGSWWSYKRPSAAASATTTAAASCAVTGAGSS